MTISKSPSNTAIKDSVTGDKANVGTKVDGTTNALHTIAEVQTDPNNPPIVELPSNHHDAFGRLRVSNPENVFEYKFAENNSFEYYFSESNNTGGTQTDLADSVSRRLSCTSTTGSEAILQTRRYIQYIVGKSQQVFITGNFHGAVANTIKCMGTYDDNNGMFFRLNGTTPEVVIRSSTSGSIVERVVTQSNWNIDKLDGTGNASAIDFTKQQLLIISYGWLGIADVTFSFYIDGEVVEFHKFRSSNIETTSYSQSGNLPVRAEIKGTGTASEMDITCIAVGREGNGADIGRLRNGNTGTSAVNFGATETFVFGIRLKSGEDYVSIKAEQFNILPRSGNDQAIYRIYYNPTLTGATWADIPNSIAQSVTNSPSFSGGLLVGSGYFNLDGKSSAGLEALSQIDIFLGKDIAGVSDNLILTIETLGGSGSANFSGLWREFI